MLAKLIAEIEKVEIFEKNKQLSYISDDPTSLINNINHALNDLDLLDTLLQMLRPISFSRLSILPKNLSQYIIPESPFPEIPKYYLLLVSTTCQKMILELNNIANFISYNLSLLLSKKILKITTMYFYPIISYHL